MSRTPGAATQHARAADWLIAFGSSLAADAPPVRPPRNKEESMTQESKWLPAQLTFGLRSWLGLLDARFRPIWGWFDWVNGGVAVMGTFMMVRGRLFADG